MFFFQVFILLYVLKGLFARTSDDDLVQSLPGLNPMPKFRQYSGYLQGATENIQLHYWLVEASTNAEKLPLVLWLNGGPGCSSLLGLLNENGPFSTGPNKKLVTSPYSWNSIANILYLESPAGVGFSYAVNGNVSTDDDIVAKNNFAALENFFKRFPSYKGRDFYITGESYGGIYVPILALLVASKPEINLRAIAVGNGLLSYDLNDNSLLYFAYYHGLLGERLWDDLHYSCCDKTFNKYCLFTRSKTSLCKSYVYEAVHTLDFGLNVYNLYAPCAGGVPPKLSRDRNNSHLDRKSADRLNLFRSNPFVLQERELAGNSTAAAVAKEVIPCSDDRDITDYLNDEDVRAALHIPFSVPAWESCSSNVSQSYKRVYQDLTKQYLGLLERKIRVLIYNGDVDMACNFLGDEWFVDALGLPLIRPRVAWYYDSTDGTRQVGGFTKTFRMDPTATDCTYLTVRGSGHMVPQDKPAQGLTLFRDFIQYTSKKSPGYPQV
uniref:Carboxypeptidase n=1 Tax=Schistocephalus solidus TaxID=70667 RepID=A0A0X3PNX8_SCHSO